MRARSLVTVFTVSCLLLAGRAGLARAETAARPAPPPARPAAAGGATGGARFAVNTGVCKDFLALAPDLRGLVVAWTAGRYHKLDRWVLDEATARKVIAGVEQECERTPDGLFRYKVVGEVNKLK